MSSWIFFARLGAGIIIGLFCMQAVASDEALTPKQWLKRMSSAMQQMDYRGIFVYRSGDELAAMKVTHLVDEHGASELLETLTGEPRQERRSAPHINQFVSGATNQLDRIDSFYTLELMGSERAAGRDAQLVSVTPKDEYRYGYRLWLDIKTGLLLKSDLLNQRGEILEQVMFTSLELISPEKRKEMMQGQEMNISKKNLADVKSSKERWQIGHLPKGFALLDTPAEDLKSKYHHMIYSDGLASVSVFVEKANPEFESFIGLSSMGAVNAYGRIESDHQLTVVGDVPRITVKTIGQSITLLEAVE